MTCMSTCEFLSFTSKIEIVILWLLLPYCRGSLLDEWIDFLQCANISCPRITEESVSMSAFSSGYTRGVWGTELFPILADINDKDDFGQHLFPAIVDNSGHPSYELLHAFACSDDINNIWSCCTSFMRASSCQNVPRNMRITMNILGEPWRQGRLVFEYLDYIASYAKNKVLPLTGINPCTSNPCSLIKHATPLSCVPLSGFENEYRCTCDVDYTWDASNNRCRLKNPCTKKSFIPCMPENTLKCLVIDTSTVLCICKTEFAGTDCSLPRNACTDRVNKSMNSGNKNCQTILGNRCIPHIGSDVYHCRCTRGFGTSIALSEDNCMQYRDPCLTILDAEHDSIPEDEVTEDEEITPATPTGTVIQQQITCLNGGNCMSSADFKRAQCVCPTNSEGEPLFEGVNCEVPVGIWSPWSTFSKCLPDCGKSRYRWRRRRCLNDSDPPSMLPYAQGKLPDVPQLAVCVGASEEVVPCEQVIPCEMLRLPGYMRYEVMDNRILYILIKITIAEVVVSIMLWLFFRRQMVALVRWCTISCKKIGEAVGG